MSILGDVHSRVGIDIVGNVNLGMDRLRAVEDAE